MDRIAKRKHEKILRVIFVNFVTESEWNVLYEGPSFKINRLQIKQLYFGKQPLLHWKLSKLCHLDLITKEFRLFIKPNFYEKKT